MVWAEVIKRLPSRETSFDNQRKIMPPKMAKCRKVHVSRPAQAQTAEDENQPADPHQLPQLDEEEPVAAPEPTTQLEAESATDTSGDTKKCQKPYRGR